MTLQDIANRLPYPSPPASSSPQKAFLLSDDDVENIENIRMCLRPRKKCRTHMNAIDSEDLRVPILDSRREKRLASRRRLHERSLISSLDDMTLNGCSNRRVVPSFLMSDFASANRGGVLANWALHEQEYVQNVPFVVAFNNVSSRETYGNVRLAIADENGNVTILDPGNDERMEQNVASHSMNPVFDVKWSACNRYILTGSGDQLAALWDVEHAKSVAWFSGHQSSIKSVAFSPHNPNILATGSRDGNICIWDIRSTPSFPRAKTNTSFLTLGQDYFTPEFEKCRKIQQGHRLDSKKLNNEKKPFPLRSKMSSRCVSITSVLFLPHAENTIISSGAANSSIKQWDIRSTGSSAFKARSIPVVSTPEPPRTSTTQKRDYGISHLSLDHSSTYLYALSMNSRIYQYNAKNLTDTSEPIQTFSHPDFKSSSFYIRTCVSPDDRYILSGSSRGELYAWETTTNLPMRTYQPEMKISSSPRKWKFSGHLQDKEVTSVDWVNASGNGYGAMGMIASSSDDYTVRLWTSQTSIREQAQKNNEYFGYAEEIH